MVKLTTPRFLNVKKRIFPKVRKINSKNLSHLLVSKKIPTQLSSRQLEWQRDFIPNQKKIQSRRWLWNFRPPQFNSVSNATKLLNRVVALLVNKCCIVKFGLDLRASQETKKFQFPASKASNYSKKLLEKLRKKASPKKESLRRNLSFNSRKTEIKVSRGSITIWRCFKWSTKTRQDYAFRTKWMRPWISRWQKSLISSMATALLWDRVC